MNATDLLRRALDATHRVTQPLLLDVEHVPTEGPFLLVGNHQLLGMQDLPALVRGIEVRRGIHLRAMADSFHFAIPVWRDLLTGMGAVVGSRDNCRALLGSGEGVLVLPGGAREVYKRRGERYRLLWSGRTGFARMAIEFAAPIVPFAAVGAEDRFDVIVDVDHPIGRPVRAVTRRIGRTDVGTVLVRGTGFAGLPGTGRLYFRFGAPIATGGLVNDPEGRRALRDRVQGEVERMIEELLAYRETDPRRGLLARVRKAV